VPEMNYYSTDKNEEGVTVPRGEICKTISFYSFQVLEDHQYLLAIIRI